MSSAQLPPLPRRAFRDLEISKIAFSDLDLRTQMNEESLDRLGETMSGIGTIQPILVSLDSETNQYRLIAGGRRVRAAVRAGHTTIPAFIVDDLSDNQALVIMLIENMQREELEPLEEARGMAELRDRFKHTERDLAAILGLRQDFVHDRLALLRLPERVRQKVEQGRLGVSQAIKITKLEGKEKTQIGIADQAEERELSVEVVERMVDEALEPKRRRKKMERRHKIKKQGDPLSEAHMKKKLQQVVLRGEHMLDILDGIALQRWSPAESEKLVQAINAIEEGLQRFKRRAAQRAREREETR